MKTFYAWLLLIWTWVKSFFIKAPVETKILPFKATTEEPEVTPPGQGPVEVIETPEGFYIIETEEKKSPPDPVPEISQEIPAPPFLESFSEPEETPPKVEEELVLKKQEEPPVLAFAKSRIGGTLNPDADVYNVNYMNNCPRISSYLIGPLD